MLSYLEAYITTQFDGSRRLGGSQSPSIMAHESTFKSTESRLAPIVI